MSFSLSCPSWSLNSRNQTPCEVVQQLDNACSYTCEPFRAFHFLSTQSTSDNTISPSSLEDGFIPYGSTVTACTCSWASYNLLSACMFCASSSPSLVCCDNWITNCPTNLTSATTYFPSYPGISLPSNASIPCYAGYNPRDWQNGKFNPEVASSIAATDFDLTPAGSCTSSSSSSLSSSLLLPSSSSPSSSFSSSSPSPSPSSSRKTLVGTIVGGIVGGVFLLLLICAAVVFAIHRRRRRTPKSFLEIADPTEKSVNMSPNDVELAAPDVPPSLPDPTLTSTPLDVITEKLPVVTPTPARVVDDAPPEVHLHDAMIPDMHHPQPAGIDMSQGITAVTRGPESDVIGPLMAADHIDSDCHPQAPSAREAIREHAPVSAIEMTTMEGYRESIGRCEEIPSRLLLASSSDSRAITFNSDGGHTDSSSREIISFRDIDVERIRNLLAQLYGDTASTDVFRDLEHSQAANLRTVSQADAEAVQALLASETSDGMMVPSVFGMPHSSPFVEARKAPVSEDMVRRVVYRYLMNNATKQNVSPSRADGLKLDLLFILDLTGSQQPYIDSVKASINTICTEIQKSDCMRLARPDDLRVAFIGFRDHPPHELSFVTREWDFTSDMTTICSNLRGLPDATGGGDVPEAVAAALDRALKMRWRNDCNRVAVLVSDAPPHGIGSDVVDFWPDGDPGVRDPLDVARHMLNNNITLHFIACEPSLSHYKNAVDFYRGLTRITSGIVIPLDDATVMATCIIGSALESLAIQDLINEYRDTLEELTASREPSLVVKYLHALLVVKDRTADQLIMENIYVTTGDAQRNVEIWSSALNLADAKAQLM